MSDLRTRILEIVSKPHLATLATITEDGKPWARYAMPWATDDMIIRCATFVHARKVAQIKTSPYVHLTCGITDPFDDRTYLQIEAEAEVVNDEDTRRLFWHDMLSHVFKGPDDPNYAVIVMKPCRIEVREPGKTEPEVWQPAS